jgi:hypothetical protein
LPPIRIKVRFHHAAAPKLVQGAPMNSMEESYDFLTLRPAARCSLDDVRRTDLLTMALIWDAVAMLRRRGIVGFGPWFRCELDADGWRQVVVSEQTADLLQIPGGWVSRLAPILFEVVAGDGWRANDHGICVRSAKVLGLGGAARLEFAASI